VLAKLEDGWTLNWPRTLDGRFWLSPPKGKAVWTGKNFALESSSDVKKLMPGIMGEMREGQITSATACAMQKQRWIKREKRSFPYDEWTIAAPGKKALARVRARAKGLAE
jgi:hypothetical protein